MSTKTGRVSKQPWAWCYVDRSRDLALIRGKFSRYALDILGEPYTWSTSGRGWVVPAKVVNDLPALAALEHEYVIVSYKPPPE